MRFILTTIAICATGMALADKQPPLMSCKSEPLDKNIAVIFKAITACYPECKDKHFKNFKSDALDNGTKICPALAAKLEKSKSSLRQWYNTQCLRGCLNVIKEEIDQGDSIQAQLGEGSFGYWASTYVEEQYEDACPEKDEE